MQFRYTDFKKTHHHKTKQEIPTQQAQNQPIKKSQNPNQQGVCVISGLDFFIIRWQMDVVCFSESHVAFVKR